MAHLNRSWTWTQISCVEEVRGVRLQLDEGGCGQQHVPHQHELVLPGQHVDEPFLSDILVRTAMRAALRAGILDLEQHRVLDIEAAKAIKSRWRHDNSVAILVDVILV